MLHNERREEGQGLVEYALAIVLVAIVTIAIVTQLGPTIAGMYCSITSSLWGSCTANAEPDPNVEFYYIGHYDDHAWAFTNNPYNNCGGLSINGHPMEEDMYDECYVEWSANTCPDSVTVNTPNGYQTSTDIDCQTG
jgi:pilus assembly protein Flp/PilA